MTPDKAAPTDPTNDEALVGLMGALSLAWSLAFFMTAQMGMTLAGLGGMSLVVALLALARREARPRVARTARALAVQGAIGAVVGVGTLVPTYALYPTIRTLLPSLTSDLRAFYDAVPLTPLTLPVVLLVIVGEELLWRGALFEAAARTRGPIRGVLSAVTLYALAQLLGGVAFNSAGLALGAAAVALGLVWSVEALVTRSVVAPLVSHAVWTLTVFAVRPLES